MVFHICNYMRETNVWMIRKCRWIFWSIGGFIPFYRNFYWDYLGRRQAWFDKFNTKSAEERHEDAGELRRNWGYNQRFEPKNDFSLKAQKYAAQTPEERVHDHPRLLTVSNKLKMENMKSAKDVRTIVNIAKEHNRQPGAFDYNYPQNFYSTFPEIERETFVTIGSGARRRVHSD